MAEDLDIQKAHRWFAADAFNACWKIIDKEERTADDDEMMLRLAEVSMWHWQQFEGHSNENLSIGYWQLARVYAMVADSDRAIYYANKCTGISEADPLGPFFVGYAYEALARATQVAHAKGGWQASLAKAYAAADSVEDEESRQQLLADLETIGPRSS